MSGRNDNGAEKKGYKGDTGSKKWTRLDAWFAVMEALGTKRFRNGKHLFLAGPNASDASVLTGLGVPIANLTAVDWDGSTAASARCRFPDLVVKHDDVRRYLRERRDFDAISLDFCAQLTDQNLDTAALAILQGLKKDGAITLTFLAGREQDESSSLRRVIARMRTHMQREFKRMSPERRAYWQPMLPALSRFWPLQRALVERTRAQGRVPVPVALYFYKSRLPGEYKGMPMCVYVASIRQCSRLAGDEELTRALEQEPELHFIDPDYAVLGRRAAVLADEEYDPCALFDVTPRELAAWKAHATRKEGV